MDVTLSVKMKQPTVHFDPPGFFARAVNRLYGRLTSLGFGPADSCLLQTRGRKSGTAYSTPVNVLRYNGKIYLVGTRGHTQWSRNVSVSGALTLKRGRTSIAFLVRALPDEEKAEILSLSRPLQLDGVAILSTTCRRARGFFRRHRAALSGVRAVCLER